MMVQATRLPKQKKREFYRLDSRVSGKGPGWELVNRSTLQSDHPGILSKIAWPDGLFELPRGPWTLPAYEQEPNLIIDLRLGHTPRDIEMMDGVFFVSPKMKSVFEDLAPGGCEFRLCKTALRTGEPGPEYWLCSVTQALKQTVDLDRSIVTVTARGSYMLSKPLDLIFKPDTVERFHVFRLAECAHQVICDEEFKARCRQLDISGASFKRIGAL